MCRSDVMQSDDRFIIFLKILLTSMPCFGSIYKSRETRQKSAAYNWDLSSAGRASALQAGGHRFEPCRSHFDFFLIKYGEIAQLARAHGSYPWCQEFESLSRYDF